MRRLRRHIRGNLVGYVALFISMSGTAWAVDTVGSGDVVDGSLRSVDLQDDSAIQGVDVVNGSLTGSQIKESTLGRVGSADELDGKGADDFLTEADKAGGDISGTWENLQIDGDTVGSTEIEAGTLQRSDMGPAAVVAWGAVASDGTLSRDYGVNDSWRLAEGTYCIDPAPDVDAQNKVVVATPNYSDDDTTEFGDPHGNGQATTVEWDSTNSSGCPSTTFEVVTYRRGCNDFGFCYVNWRRDEGFFFAIR